jgi:hypothetical protein
VFIKKSKKTIGTFGRWCAPYIVWRLSGSLKPQLSLDEFCSVFHPDSIHSPFINLWLLILVELIPTVPSMHFHNISHIVVRIWPLVCKKQSSCALVDWLTVSQIRTTVRRDKPVPSRSECCPAG